MSWAENPLTIVGPSLLLLCAVLAWWYTEPKTAQLNIIVLVGCVFFLWAVNPELARDLPSNFWGYCTSAVFLLHLDRLVAGNARMLCTGAAVVWLLRRAFQTLWKPVPELIGVLGLEVPDPPDVSLTGIGADKATLTWTRPQPNRPVQKFLIQVNGVNVGEIASNHDNFIIVSGLKPDHFYNVRVIAVGSNNFQAGSRVIRLRTFAKDGRPQLGNSRVPSSFSPDDQGPPSQTEGVDENGTPRNPVPTVETATISEVSPAVVARESNPSAAPGLRRNTVGRRHSPSTTSLDQQHQPPPPPLPTSGETMEPTDAQMDELGEKYKALLRETQDVVDVASKEEDDHKLTMNELEAEKQEKKKEQKKKEEQTEKLRREQGTMERLMRNSLQRKAQKEKLLREKQAERTKLEEQIAHFSKKIEEMRKDQSSFAKETEKLEGQKRGKEEALGAEISELQKECGNMEAELKERRAQVKALEDARKRLPGGEADAEGREKDAELRKDWHRRERELQATLEFENKRTRQLDEHTLQLSTQLQQIQLQQEFYIHANSSGIDFGGDSASGQMKRRSRNSNSMSNLGVVPSPAMPPGYPMPVPLPVPLPGATPDPAAAAIATTSVGTTPGLPVGLTSAGFVSSVPSRLSGPPGFAPGPFMGGVPADAAPDGMSQIHEAELRALMGDAPLSPTAKSLLPSHIFMDMDMDDDDPSPGDSPYVAPRAMSPANNDPHSPSSSSRSMSILSSPHGSSHNLPYPTFSGDAVERRSMKGSRDLGGPMSSPAMTAGQPAGNLLSNILKFQRRPAKPAPEPVDEEGPPLGSLKAGQSQSFPRQTDEPETLANRRRISLSSWNGMFNRNSTGPELPDGRPHHPPARFSARNLLPFGGHRATSGVFAEGDPSSPRPASIASADLPRPSTESSSIWGPPADTHNPLVVGKTWPWSPENAWSRNPSRRPSLHGSPSALKTTLASADDEILDEEALMRHNALPSQVGVIGSRPPTAKKMMKTLNPAAPTFMTTLLNQMTSKDKTKDKVKDPKEKLKGKESKEPGSNPDASAATTGTGVGIGTGTGTGTGDESPSDSRISKDALSVHTQTSVSESRDSLSLDMSFSNTTMDYSPGGSHGFGPTSAKEPDNVVKKLFRKGSSSKFSFSSRLGKKGPGSVANSDKNASVNEARSSIGDAEDVGGALLDESSSAFLGRSYDSVTSSPSLGPSKSGKERPESRMNSSRWFSIKKKGKEKESLEIEREKATESLGGPAVADERRVSKEA